MQRIVPEIGCLQGLALWSVVSVLASGKFVWRSVETERSNQGSALPG